MTEKRNSILAKNNASYCFLHQQSINENKSFFQGDNQLLIGDVSNTCGPTCTETI